MITLPSLNRCPGVVHAFMTRAGGVSMGLYQGLNCGFGSADDPDKVAINRTRALARLGLGTAALVTVQQIHSAAVAVVDAPWPHSRNPQADALVTRLPGVALGILTADCVPVLFADPGAGVIGAAHAGWKGATGGVLEATVARMIDLGARAADIRAAIGPAIQQPSYEVGPEFFDRLVTLDPGYARFTAPAPRPGHFLFDLPGFVEMRLRAAGLVEIDRAVEDTLVDEARFFSYRRTTHRREPDYGRQISLVALAGKTA
jgi:YfiH family protein